MLIEISQRKTYTVCHYLYVESKKHIYIYRKTDSDTGKKLVVTNGEREGQGTR